MILPYPADICVFLVSLFFILSLSSPRKSPHQHRGTNKHTWQADNKEKKAPDRGCAARRGKKKWGQKERETRAARSHMMVIVPVGSAKEKTLDDTRLAALARVIDAKDAVGIGDHRATGRRPECT